MLDNEKVNSFGFLQIFILSHINVSSSEKKFVFFFFILFALEHLAVNNLQIEQKSRSKCVWAIRAKNDRIRFE